MRRPVSKIRARTGWICLTALVVGFSLFQWTTSDAAIRRRAISFLRQATGGDIEVGSARFSLFGGITLSDVRVSTPFDAALDAGARSPAQREIFSARRVQLVPDPWRLLGLGFVIDEIIAAQPRLTIVQNVENARFNWQSLVRGPRAPRSLHGAALRPDMRLRDAQVVLVSIDASGRHHAAPVRLDADVHPHPILPTAFLVDVRRYGNRPDRGRMIYDPVEGTLSETPIVGLGTIRSLLPKVYQEFFTKFALTGDIRSQQMRYGSSRAGQQRYELELRGVELTVPLALLRSNAAAANVAPRPEPGLASQTAFHLHDINGTLDLAGDDIRVDLRGFLDAAACHISGIFRDVERPVEQMGLELTLDCTGFVMPEDETRARLVKNDAVPYKLREFFREFDPHGPFDAACTLRRPPGPAQLVRFRGLLQPRGGNAMYEWFPYRLDHLAGRVRFGDDAISLESITGKHGSATVLIDGRVDNPNWWTGVDLRITGDLVPLDSALYSVLGPKYQRLWSQFDPRGAARTSVHVMRPTGDDKNGPKPWQTRVTVDLIDARACFNQFPYPLESVSGRIVIAPGEMHFESLAGRSVPIRRRGGPPADIRIDGSVVESGDQPRIDLQLRGDRLRFDDRLAAALPADARAAFEQFNPAGTFNLRGRIFTDPAQPGLQYDLESELTGARIVFAELSYPIADLYGKLRITPRRAAVIDLSGHHGETKLSASGEVRRTNDGYVADLSLRCDGLVLDDELHRSLPGELKDVWALLMPAGSIDVTTQLHRVRNGDVVTHRHQTEVHFDDARLCYRGFPLPLTNVRGSARINDRRIELGESQGRCGDGDVRVSGSIDRGSAGLSGVLSLHGKSLAFSDALRNAMPESIAEGWRSLQPHGRFDVDLDLLRFDTNADGSTNWDWQGRAAMHDAGLRAGLDLTHVSGQWTGQGAMNSRGLRLDGEAAFSRAQFGVFDLRDLTMRAVVDPASPALRLSDCTGRLFGGRAAGFCNLTFDPGSPRYELSMTVSDAELRDYLAATGVLKSTPQQVRGRLFGKLFLRGQAGLESSRRGGGEFFLREAQAWKMPLIFAIFRVLNLSPDENMFHDAWLQFFLEGRMLRFTKIDLQGKTLSLVGSGTMNTQTDDLNVVLVAGSPHRLRVPLLTELLEGASRDLLEVQISGPSGHPQIESRPLRDVRRALEAISPNRHPSDSGAQPPPGR